MKKANIVEFPELLRHAETLGYDWNKSCKLLDSLRPRYEINKIEFSVTELWKKETDEGFDEWNDTEYSKEFNHIMSDYFEKNNVKQIVIVND